MDTATIISILSLVVAALALPTSYWVAVRQVKIGLDEYERRSKKRARELVVAAIDEFFRVFFAAVEQIVHIRPEELQARLSEIDSHIAEIDTFVERTKVLERLSLAIDHLFATGSADLPEDIVKRLQSVRGQIHLGSSSSRSATLGVIKICDGDRLSRALMEA